jgi:GST-like protein
MLTLYGCKGCGSVAIEAMLKLSGLPFSKVSWDFEDEAAWSKFAAISAQRQVPTLMLEDGTMMSESLAIVFWLLQRFPQSPLLPAADPERALMFRWLAYVVTNMYCAIGIGDYPQRWVGDDATAVEALRQGALERTKAGWLLMEQELPGTAYLLGEHMSALDVYCAMMTHWRPRAAWFADHCPKIMAAARATEAHPVVAQVFLENFAP